MTCLEQGGWVSRPRRPLALLTQNGFQALSIEGQAAKYSDLALFLGDQVEVELQEVADKVDVFRIDGQQTSVLDYWSKVFDVQRLYELVIVGQLSEEDANLLEYTCV